MSEIKASDINQMREELLSAIFAPILLGIVEHAKEIEKIKEEEEDAQNIGKKECCVQDGRCTFDE